MWKWLLCLVVCLGLAGCSLEFREKATDVEREIRISESAGNELTAAIEWRPDPLERGSRWC